MSEERTAWLTSMKKPNGERMIELWFSKPHWVEEAETWLARCEPIEVNDGLVRSLFGVVIKDGQRIQVNINIQLLELDEVL